MEGLLAAAVTLVPIRYRAVVVLLNTCRSKKETLRAAMAMVGEPDRRYASDAAIPYSDTVRLDQHIIGLMARSMESGLPRRPSLSDVLDPVIPDERAERPPPGKVKYSATGEKLKRIRSLLAKHFTDTNPVNLPVECVLRMSQVEEIKYMGIQIDTFNPIVTPARPDPDPGRESPKRLRGDQILGQMGPNHSFVTGIAMRHHSIGDRGDVFGRIGKFHAGVWEPHPTDPAGVFGISPVNTWRSAAAIMGVRVSRAGSISHDFGPSRHLEGYPVYIANEKMLAYLVEWDETHAR
jgi:hypothetical protein